MITILIHTGNEYPDMQANKLNAKYHLHVQHSTNATMLENCIKDIKSNKWHKSDVLKKKIKQQANIAIHKTTPPFSMHTSPSCVALPLTVCYLSLPFCHE